jgi:hypothetical protein
MGDILTKLCTGFCTCFYRDNDIIENNNNTDIKEENQCYLYKNLYHDELYSNINNYINNSNRTYIDI